MKIGTKKSILQKITIIILTVLCVNLTVPTYSNADGGGILASPFVDFFCSIGDVVINLLQKFMQGNSQSTGGINMSLNAFLMPSEEYYASHYKAGKPASECIHKVNPQDEFDKGWLSLLGAEVDYHIPIATYSPEEIFKGEVSGLDINFINPKYDEDEGGSAATLQSTIAQWYVALRNLATVGLLCVLVYVGIRMILSSTASDKAKYKQMLIDWIVALCLLFFLHYIMTFVLTLTDSICEALSNSNSAAVSVYDESAGKSFSTNLIGLARFNTQYKDFGPKFTYLIFYLALVTYTVMFTWQYLRRLVTMAFLTIIAPLVAFTYPIDKIGDGQAQAFNMWLKEYIYNALIQPFHLILYTVLIGTATQLVEKNLVYAIVALGFMIPAEKLLKQMFGFSKAGTISPLTALTLGALGGSAAAKNRAKADKGGDSKEDESPRYQRTHGTDGIGGPGGPGPGIEEPGMQEQQSAQPGDSPMPGGEGPTGAQQENRSRTKSK